MSFNPYSIGSYSGSGYDESSGVQGNNVSILILLEVTLEVNLKQISTLKAIVSILILLEVTLEGKLEWMEQLVQDCFNPYSIGSYSGRFLQF